MTYDTTAVALAGVAAIVLIWIISEWHERRGFGRRFYLRVAVAASRTREVIARSWRRLDIALEWLERVIPDTRPDGGRT